MSEAGPRDRVVDDHMFEVRYPRGGRLASCRLQLFTAPGRRPVAVATWAPGDGRSLTNAAERLAVAAWRRYAAEDAEPPIWVQCQHVPSGAHYDVVTFKVPAHFTLASPSWRPITAADLAELVGTDVDASRGEGFVPPPEPIEMTLYEVRWVVALPRPHPFREPHCMPGGGPGLAYRLRRQLVPQRSPSGCCWYHGGDWATASRTAIRLLHQARAAGTSAEDTYDFVMARAKSEGTTGWASDAIESLVHPPEAIILERDRSQTVYVNGQHRAQAMLDQGVRRTVTVLTWEETSA